MSARELLAAPLQRLDPSEYAKGLAHRPASDAKESTPAPAAPLETAQAITSAARADTVALSNETLANVQAVIARLNQAATAADASEALSALKDLVEQNTNAGQIGTALEELAGMADELMHMIESNPDAIGGGFSLKIQANFMHHAVQGSGYSQQMTSFSMRFNLVTGDTMMQGSMSFDEKLSITDNSLRYESAERVSLRMLTYNPDVASNPVMDAFNAITQKLTGINLAAGLGGQGEADAPALSGGAYAMIDFFEKLKIRLEELADVSDKTQRLLETLAELGRRTEQEPQAA